MQQVIVRRETDALGHPNSRHFHHHNGPVWKCLGYGEAQGQSADCATTVEKVCQSAADRDSINKGNCEAVPLVGQFWTAPARFLLHSNALTLGAAVPLDYNFLDAQLQQIKSLNQMVVQVVSASSNKKASEVEDAIHGQTILTAEQAKQWGIVQEIRTTFMEPGAVLISVDSFPPEKKSTPEYSTIQPTVTAGNPSNK